MLNKILVIINIIFYLFFYGCSNDNSWKGTIETKNGVKYIHNIEKGLWGESKILTLKKVLSIGLEKDDENYIFAGIRDIVVDNTGNIYVLDSKDNCLKIFNKNGKFIKIIGKKGKGPSELLGPIKMALGPDGKIYVLEVGNRRISVLSFDGDLLYSFPYRYSSSELIVNKDNGHVFLFSSSQTYNQTMELENVIYEYNLKGKIVNSFGSPIIVGKSTYKNQHAIAHLTPSYNNFFYCAFENPYLIRIYNYKEELKRVITRKSPLFSEPVKVFLGGGLLYWVNQSEIAWIVSFPDGKFLTVIREKEEFYIEKFSTGNSQSINPSKFHYDLFDSEGHFLKTFVVKQDEPIIMFIDSEGYAYTVSHDFQIPVVEKFIITFDK